MKKGTNSICGTTTKYRYGCRCAPCTQANRDYWTKFREKNKDKLLIKWREQHHNNKEKRNAQSVAYGILHKEQTKAKTKEKRIACLMHYSQGTMACKCCGENTYEFLSLDHVNNGGTQHRKLSKGRIEPKLVKAGFPEGFQVLCHNCNMAKGFYGKCPHQV